MKKCCDSNGTCKCKCDGKNGKDLLVGQLKAAIKEMIKQTISEMENESIEEVSGTGAVGGYATPFAFGKKGKDIATKSLPGFKVAKDIDEEKEEVPVKKVKPSTQKVAAEPSPRIEAPPKVSKSDIETLEKNKKMAAFRRDKKGEQHNAALLGLVKKSWNK